MNTWDWIRLCTCTTRDHGSTRCRARIEVVKEMVARAS